MKQIGLFILGLFALNFIGCKNAGEKASADIIYYGGDIITMEGDSAVYAEAVEIKNGKIIFVGNKAEA